MDKSKYDYILVRTWEQLPENEEADVQEECFDMSTTKGQDDLKYYLQALKKDGFGIIDVEYQLDCWDDASIFLTVYAAPSDESNIDDAAYNKLIRGEFK